MMHYGWNDGGWGIAWMLVSMVALVAIVWAIVMIAVRSSAGDRTPESDAEDVLNVRFAKGEIDENEYRARRAVLDEAPRHPSEPSKKGGWR